MGPTIISVWSLLQEIILGVGANELHRQLVNRLQKRDAASPDFQEALYHSLLRAVDTLGKALSTEDLPYFQSIPDLRERREEQQRVREIFNTIQARFPTMGTFNQPVDARSFFLKVENLSLRLMIFRVIGRNTPISGTMKYTKYTSASTFAILFSYQSQIYGLQPLRLPPRWDCQFATIPHLPLTERHCGSGCCGRTPRSHLLRHPSPNDKTRFNLDGGLCARISGTRAAPPPWSSSRTG